MSQKLCVILLLCALIIPFVHAFHMRSSRMAMRSSSRSLSLEMQATKENRLEVLLEITKEACDAVSPMLSAFYKEIRVGANGADKTATFKSDATFFTIADGIVQHMFIEYLFAGDKFHQIVGEEDESVINILETPYTVDDLSVPDQFEEIVQETLEKVKALRDKIDPNLYKDITIFVDPIDGTREFATGNGDKVTILVGYNDESGHPQGGIIYRPLTEPTTWAAGAKSEGYKAGVLDIPDEPAPKGLLITDGKVSPFLNAVIDTAGFYKVPSVASGNRALMIVEGKAGAYIRDTGGFAKWDTSGPQAVVEAYGGTMSKLPEFLADKSLVSYTHLKTDLNLDFCKRSVGLTLSNAKDKSIVHPGLDSIITDVHLVKEYSCVQGLVCLGPGKMEGFYLNAIHAAMESVKREQGINPTYT